MFGKARTYLALAALTALALLVPPTGADFNFRAYQLPMAIVAGILMLVILLLVQRRQLAGQQGVDIDAWPGRVPAPEPESASH
jgi:alpha-1,6-mannosyltransferase